MAGFVRAATVMHNSAQSGSSSSSLLLDPRWSDLTKVGLGQLGSLPLCAVNLGDLVDLHTKSNRSSTNWLPVLPGGRLHSKQIAAEIAITLPASPHSPEPSHIYTHLHCSDQHRLSITKKKKKKNSASSFIWMKTQLAPW